MKNRITQTLTLALAATLLAACQDYLPLGGVADGGTGSNPASDLFNFSTTKEVSVNINYGKKGSRALVDIFTEDPAYIGTDGEMHFKEDAEFKVFLDENGRYKGKVVLPADTKQIWVYTMRQTLPQLMTASVNSNGAVVTYSENPIPITENPGYTPKDQLKIAGADQGKRDEDFQEIATSTSETTKDGKPLTIWRAATRSNPAPFGRKDKTYSIVNWQGQRFGRIIPTHYYDTEGNCYKLTNTEGTYDTQGLIGEDKNPLIEPMTQDDIDIIQHFLWNNNEIKPNGLNNRKYYDGLDTEDINTVIPHTYIENGEVQTVDKAQVWLRFLGEGAYYNDGIGYYVYDTDNPPTSQDSIKAYYIAIPNTSSTAPYGNVTLYITNNDGTVTEQQTDFKGRTIPYITYPNINISGNDETVGTVLFKPIEPVYNETTKGYDYKIVDKQESQWTWLPKFVPFDTNQRIQLLYHDPETNEVSKYFPPGKTIGFFLTYVINQDTQLMGYETFRIFSATEYFHSDWRLNEPQKYKDDDNKEHEYEYNDQGEGILDTEKNPDIFKDDRYGTSKVGTGNNIKTISLRHFIALNYKGYAIYGVEDGVDDSMGDVLFAIETDPMGIVVNDDRVTILPEMYATTTNHRTYAFEDIWPTGGDYDMNDVVIDHHHRMTIKRDGNGRTDDDWITSIEDDFTAIQPKGSATYQDAFGIQIPKTRLQNREGINDTEIKARPSMQNIFDGMNSTYALKVQKEENGTMRTLTEDEYILEEDDDNDIITLILFTDARDENVRYNKYTVTRVFDTPFANGTTNGNVLHIDNTQLEQGGINVLNPFIISQYDKNSDDGRIEIHLPLHKPTAKGLKLNDTSDPANYYVGKYNGQHYPFAISLPKSAFNYPWGQHFANISGEGIEMKDAYPKYSEWVKKPTTDNADWYRYPEGTSRPTPDNSDTTQSE